MTKNRLTKAVSLSSLLFLSSFSYADRVKDYAAIEGVRQNQLIGYGLVVGLDGTGDQMQQTPFAVQSTISMLNKLGVSIPSGTQLQLKNIASVIITANLPPFAKVGQPIDITVSSMGNAKSLKGGTLVATPLKGLNGEVFAIAQGNLVVGGSGVDTPAVKVQTNHLNVGRIPGGATIEKSIDIKLGSMNVAKLGLFNSDFAMAGKIAAAINAKFPGSANAVDARLVEIDLPEKQHDKVLFLGEVEQLPLDGSVYPSKIVINARTGSVVMNQMVRLEPCAVAHGGLTVQITEELVISQPAPGSLGRTVVDTKVTASSKQQGGFLIRLPQGSSLLDLVTSINQIGANPADLISILQSMKAAGAIRAEIDII